MAKTKTAKLTPRAEPAESTEPELSTGADDGAGSPKTSSAEPTEPSEPAEWLGWVEGKLTSDRLATLVVLLFGAVMFLPALGSVSLWDPWETHYGEVAREMIARDDYVYPHWESSYFFSKPALPLWLMALGMVVVGADSGPPLAPLGAFTEWGVRMPFALIAIGTMWAVYRMGRQMVGRTAGVAAAVVLGSSAQFIFIGKQSMVDMPFVGFLTIGLALFCAAVFDEDEDRPANRLEKGLAGAGIALALFPQLALIGREIEQGLAIGGVAAAGLVGLVGVFYAAALASKRDCYLIGFYVCIALSALSKGLGPIAVLGVTGILYLMVSLDFRVLQRAKLWLGLPLFLVVAVPWYLTLSLFDGRNGEGKTFVDRFWLHDNFNRVGAGVHGDRGGLGYYFEQLAYGMFPWFAVVPHALGWAGRYDREDASTQKKRMMLFVVAWALGAFIFFTMNQTKFHHYIFPAVPALALLVGLWFTRVAEAPGKHLTAWAVLPIIALFAVSARDLINDPQDLVRLFTYKYDRDYPRELNPRIYIEVIVAAGSVALLAFFLVGKRGRAMLAFAGMSVAFGMWISHHHFNMLSPHWGQKHLFETFYEERQGDEPIYAYQLNWRGETFYSRNTILQVKESGANQRIRQLVDRPGREFIITEQSRFHTLKSVLSPDKRDKARILDRSSNKFYLIVVEE